jgi:hypothetical protein
MCELTPLVLSGACGLFLSSNVIFFSVSRIVLVFLSLLDGAYKVICGLRDTKKCFFFSFLSSLHVLSFLPRILQSNLFLLDLQFFFNPSSFFFFLMMKNSINFSYYQEFFFLTKQEGYKKITKLNYKGNRKID